MVMDDPQQLSATLQDIRHAVSDINKTLDGLQASVDPAFGKMQQKANQAKDGLDDLTKQLNEFRGATEKAFSAGITSAIKGGDGFTTVFTKMKNSLEDLVIQLAVVNPVLNTLFGENKGTVGDFPGFATQQQQLNGGGLVGSLFNTIASLFDARAFGGPVNAGQPYLVGEGGPELFVPQSAGRINANGGGGSPLNIVMNISTQDAGSFRASQNQIAAAMMDAARRANRIR